MNRNHSPISVSCVRQESDATLAARCKRSGLRVTRARLALYHSIVQRCDHPDVECLFNDIRSSVPSISLNTVYRTMHAFQSAGLVVCVASWNGVARYDGNVNPHAHFLCDRCGAIGDIDGCNLPKLDRALVESMYGTIGRAELLLRGTCRRCLGTTSSA